MKSLGYKDEDIKQIRIVNYEEEMKKRVDKQNKLSNSELNKIGYSKEQIKAIREYDGTEEQLQLLSASLTLTNSIGLTGKSSSYSYAYFDSYWTWSVRPVFIFIDILAIAWIEGMYLDSSSAYVDYYNDTYETYQYTKNFTVETKLNTGAYFKFPMMWDHYAYTYAKKGRLSCEVTRQAYVSQMAIQSEY